MTAAAPPSDGNAALLLGGGRIMPTREQVLDIRANFCGAHDAQGRVIFDPFIASLALAERADWYTRKHGAGLTHLVVAPNCSYPGSPIPGFDFRRSPLAFRALLDEVLAQGFIPIVMMTDGGLQGPGEILGDTWAQMWPAVSDLQSWCVWVPGWETGGAWRAKDTSDVLLWMARTFAASTVVALECIPERGTAASWPVEPDDPWRGNEIEMWRSFGGERVNAFFYETGHGSGLFSFDSRWDDIVSRLGAGQHGWRPLERCVFFESVAYDYYHGRCTDAQRDDLTARALRVYTTYGVTPAWGNGVPQ